MNHDQTSDARHHDLSFTAGIQSLKMQMTRVPPGAISCTCRAVLTRRHDAGGAATSAESPHGLRPTDSCQRDREGTDHATRPPRPARPADRRRPGASPSATIARRIRRASSLRQRRLVADRICVFRPVASSFMAYPLGHESLPPAGAFPSTDASEP